MKSRVAASGNATLCTQYDAPDSWHPEFRISGAPNFSSISDSGIFVKTLGSRKVIDLPVMGSYSFLRLPPGRYELTFEIGDGEAGRNSARRAGDGAFAGELDFERTETTTRSGSRDHRRQD